MIHAALGRPAPVELTSDRRIQGRVGRLAGVSLAALGLVFGLAVATLHASGAWLVMLAAGWATMPAILAWSLRTPAARYLLVVPSALVAAALLGICATALPASPAAALGWLVLTAGVLLGGALGIWFWFRVLPVPGALDQPLAPGRWALIAVHVALVAIGWSLAAGA